MSRSQHEHESHRNIVAHESSNLSFVRRDGYGGAECVIHSSILRVESRRRVRPLNHRGTGWYEITRDDSDQTIRVRFFSTYR